MILNFQLPLLPGGMLLRNSEYKGTATYDLILEWAKEGKGEDKNGYRAEFIRLVELTKLM
jgi:Ca-activated chloride channel family protein